ncbi:MAG: ComEC/Rec2 family competence protein, partial [Elusimicrobia bacterium]|nr:ComEC/Rec2 family competence protein [Elusimicrobiota bacterium]
MIRIREKSVPLLLPFAAVIAGIILGSVSAAGTAFISYAGIALSLLALAALKIYKKSRFIPHAVLLLLFFFSSLNYKFNIAPSKNDVSGMVPFRGEITGTVKLSRRNFIVKADLAEGRKVRGSVLVRYDGSIPRQGARVKISGDFKNPPGPQNPGQFDWKKYLACNRIFTECDARQVEVIKENFIVKYVGSVREYIEKSIKAYLPEDEAGVLLGMLLGDVSKVPRELFEQFRYAGIVHVLAVSGLHVGLVLFTFYYILTAFGTGKERALLVSLVFMALYVVITGARPSAVRAAVMLFMLTAGRMMGERGNVYNSLCFAGIIILLVRPGLLFTLGFVLSFTAVAGIIYLYPFFAKFMWRPLAVSLSAMLGISPVLAWNFYYL